MVKGIIFKLFIKKSQSRPESKLRIGYVCSVVYLHKLGDTLYDRIFDTMIVSVLFY